MRFLDSERHRTGSQDKLDNMPVLDQNMVNSEQSNEDNFVKKCENIKVFRIDLINLVMGEYNYTVESVPDLLADFNRRYPGYKQVLEYKDLLNEAEGLH
jgi:putative DNA primase/helicase